MTAIKYVAGQIKQYFRRLVHDEEGMEVLQGAILVVIAIAAAAAIYAVWTTSVEPAISNSANNIGSAGF